MCILSLSGCFYVLIQESLCRCVSLSLIRTGIMYGDARPLQRSTGGFSLPPCLYQVLSLSVSLFLSVLRAVSVSVPMPLS